MIGAIVVGHSPAEIANIFIPIHNTSTSTRVDGIHRSVGLYYVYSTVFAPLPMGPPSHLVCSDRWGTSLAVKFSRRLAVGSLGAEEEQARLRCAASAPQPPEKWTRKKKKASMIEKGGARVRRRFPTVLQMQDAAFPAEVAFFSSSYTATFPIIYHPALSKSLGSRRGDTTSLQSAFIATGRT